MKKKPPITLVFKDFQVFAPLADSHVCGSGNKEGFTATAELTVRDLDHNGFVIDTMHFLEVVRSAYGRTMHVASCEQLAEGIISLAISVVGDRLISAEARVINKTGYVTILWTEGQEKPPFPRRASASEAQVATDRQREGDPPKGC